MRCLLNAWPGTPRASCNCSLTQQADSGGRQKAARRRKQQAGKGSEGCCAADYYNCCHGVPPFFIAGESGTRCRARRHALQKLGTDGGKHNPPTSFVGWDRVGNNKTWEREWLHMIGRASVLD